MCVSDVDVSDVKKWKIATYFPSQLLTIDSGVNGLLMFFIHGSVFLFLQLSLRFALL